MEIYVQIFALFCSQTDKTNRDEIVNPASSAADAIKPLSGHLIVRSEVYHCRPIGTLGLNVPL